MTYEEQELYNSNMFKMITDINGKFIKKTEAKIKELKEDLQINKDKPVIVNSILKQKDKLAEKLDVAIFIRTNFTSYIDKCQLDDLIFLFNNENYISREALRYYRADKYSQTPEFKKSVIRHNIIDVLLVFLILCGPIIFFTCHLAINDIVIDWAHFGVDTSVIIPAFVLDGFITLFGYGLISPVMLPIQIWICGVVLNVSNEIFFTIHFQKRFGIPAWKKSQMGKYYITAAASHLYLSHALKNSGGWIEKK